MVNALFLILEYSILMSNSAVPGLTSPPVYYRVIFRSKL